MRGLVLLMSLAACDHVFGIGDPYQDAPPPVRDGSAGPADVAIDVPPNLPQPLVHYRFDGDFTEAGGGSAASCTTSGGTDCQFVLGRYGIAVHLDGSSIGQITLPNLPLRFTLMAWVLIDDGPIFVLPQLASAPTSDAWYLLFGSGMVDFVTQSAATQDTRGTLPSSSGWVHIAVTYDGSTQLLYVDEVAQTPTAVMPIVYGPNSILYFGAHLSDTPTTYYLGAIDDVYVFARPLTLSEIGAYANMPR